MTSKKTLYPKRLQSKKLVTKKVTLPKTYHKNMMLFSLRVDYSQFN